MRDIDGITERYPAPDMTPAQFEDFVADLLGSTAPEVDQFELEVRERLQGVDGEYEIDATVRFQLMGVAYLTLVEAKMHKNPIKRDVLQVLNDKIRSVGAHKGIVVTTSSYQSGALDYARLHGIALVTVTEGRFTVEALSAGESRAVSAEMAREFGLPDLVAHSWQLITEADGRKVRCTTVSERGELALDLLLPDTMSEDATP